MRMEEPTLVAMVAKGRSAMTQEVFCKACGSDNVDVIESRVCKNGTRRRRHRCLSCSCRWTYWDGPRPPRGRVMGNRSTCSRRGYPMTMDEVKHILLAPLQVTNAQLARETNFSTEWVRRVRTGLAHASIHPELERRKPSTSSANGRSCYNCSHWSPGCDFGFPDSYKEGPGYAQDCDLFKLKKP